MKARINKELDKHHDRPASGHRRQRQARAGFDDRRGSTASQRRLIQDIDNSPSMSLQRKQLEESSSVLVQRIEDEELLQGRFDTLQRVSPEEDEELMQGKFDGLQRQPEDEEELQGKFESLQRQPEEEEPLQGRFFEPVQTEQQDDAALNRTGMPDELKAGIESLSGMDISAVRVHYNSPRPAQLNARAYAQGKDIHLGSGQEKHLPHEAWHVVQQQQGRVQPTTSIAGERVNDDPGLEREADIMGARALREKK